MFLLDTNVISELMTPRPNPMVVRWVDSQPLGELWTSAIVAAELFSGLEMMPAGKRQDELWDRAEKMFTTLFAERILPFNRAEARAFGIILKVRKAMGRPIDEMDALIAATALIRGATVATRNTRDFEFCGVQLIDPWQSA